MSEPMPERFISLGDASFQSLINPAYVERLEADYRKLRAALAGLYADDVDYLTLNHLGGMDNHWMRAAREALSSTTDLPEQL